VTFAVFNVPQTILWTEEKTVGRMLKDISKLCIKKKQEHKQEHTLGDNVPLWRQTIFMYFRAAPN